MQNFADRLCGATRALGSPVVAGIDPTLKKLPAFILERAAATAGPTPRGAAVALRDFTLRIIDAVAGVVPVVKLQSAFYETYGPYGVEAFWDGVAAARAAGLLVIADIKRGDIGTTAAAYADGYLADAEPALWLDGEHNVDAITVNPYLGSDGLEPFVQRAAAGGRGLFVLVKTSNPSSGELQDQPLLSGETVAQQVAKLVHSWGEPLVGASGYSSVGAVVGATYPEAIAQMRGEMPQAIFLVPGYGAQGGTAADAAAAFHPNGLGAVVAASRSLIYPYDAATVTPAAMATAVRQAALAMTAEINAVLAAR